MDSFRDAVHYDSVTSSLLVLAISCSFVFAMLKTWKRVNTSKKRTLKRLPGPPPEPFFGHIRSIPLNAAWITFAEWYRKYGSVTMVRILGRPMVIINTLEAAHNLLEKKGANFSNRPPLLVFREWLGWKYGLAFVPEDNYCRKVRRLMRRFMTSQAMAQHRPILYETAQEMIDDLKRSPGAFEEHIHNYVTRSLMRIVYGNEPASDSESLISLAGKFGDIASRVDVTTAMILDIFPFLSYLPEWFPGMGEKKKAMMGRETLEEVEDRSLAHLLHLRNSGLDSACIMSKALDDLHEETGDVETALKDYETRKKMVHIGVSIFIGGAETSVSTLVTFIFAMLLYPNVASRAQREIDRVTGGPGVRLPTREDRDKLPYIDYIIKESLRWNPAVPLGIVHQSKDVDEYEGMEVPANSSVIANIWFMCHDESRYSSPDEFNPDRFLKKTSLGSNADVAIGEEDPARIAFGFGRRICPGEHVADDVLWTAVAFILATFNITPPLDPLGKPILPSVKFTNGTTSRPEVFRCIIKPRV